MARKSVADLVEQPVSKAKGETREHLTQQIISAFDSLVRSNMLGTSAGDVSVRISGTDNILITPHMPFIEKLAASDLLEVTMDGQILHKRGRPSFSQQMHLAIYKQRPDVKAIVHCHAPVATVLGICELPIPPVTVDAVAFVDLPRVPASMPYGEQWVQEIATRLAGGAPAALLLHHGIVTVGANLQQAVRRTLTLEETARILVVCYLLQQVPIALPPEVVEILQQALL